MLEVLRLSAEDKATSEKAVASRQGLKASAERGKAEKGEKAKDDSRAVALMVGDLVGEVLAGTQASDETKRAIRQVCLPPCDHLMTTS